jgi:RNA polymerase sigma-70 factor (ECF subfamily)
LLDNFFFTSEAGCSLIFETVHDLSQATPVSVQNGRSTSVCNNFSLPVSCGCIMHTEMTGIEYQGAQQDEAAVAAVRGGDAERYRELVERHERRVFAVAWSRLGDAALAEEVTQEAFIRAYRRLWLLGDGAKFAGWVNTIARRVAINFGLRHRRELNKRERWALENPPVSTAENAGETDPLYTPETLRQTLAGLPAAHRECLVLFYIEGKSGAEAAAALGISESALRVRLHRARGAMRERLEEKLEGSLIKLGPAKSLVPGVMAGVLASSSAKMATAGGTAAAGVGAKMLSMLGKTFLFSWMAPLIWLVPMLPGLGLQWFFMRSERRNFRDTGGFRPELHRQFSRSFMWGFPLMVVAMMAISLAALTFWGVNGQQFALAGFVVALTLISARSLTICRNPFQVGMFAYCVIIAAGLSALALGWLPRSLALLPPLAASTLFLLVFKKRPARMDYNLFLRAAHGLLKFPAAVDEISQENHFDREALLAFARFLGSRFLVINFRWETNGLALRLPPLGSRFLAGMAAIFMPPISRNCSHILLGWDGKVSAHCGETDSQTLSALKTARMIDAKELEGIVAEIVGLAWREFRHGNPVAVEAALGDSPEANIFVVPQARAKATRWWRIYLGAAIGLMMVALIVQYWQPPWMGGLKPVHATEAQVRAFLNDTTPNPDRKKFKPNSPALALFTCLVLPSTNLYSPAGLRVMRDEVAGDLGFEFWKKSIRPGHEAWVLNAPLVREAVSDGWISWSDLGIQPAEAAASLRANTVPQVYPPDKWDCFLTRCQSWSWVKEEKFDVMRIQSDGLAQLRLLRSINCLDLVDREKLVRQIASVQDLSATQALGQPPIHDWRDVRGLFFTPNFPVLQDTYYSLAALEILGGLDKIDSEACIKGILSRHRGKGWFTSPNSGGFNEYHIDGSARDTIAAYESLRILGALDRVKDLAQWQFRPQRRGIVKGQLTWQDVEAWVCQQRLGKILRQRKENPQAPAGSLLAGTIELNTPP